MRWCYRVPLGTLRLEYTRCIWGMRYSFAVDLNGLNLGTGNFKLNFDVLPGHDSVLAGKSPKWQGIEILWMYVCTALEHEHYRLYSFYSMPEAPHKGNASGIKSTKFKVSILEKPMLRIVKIY